MSARDDSRLTETFRLSFYQDQDLIGVCKIDHDSFTAAIRIILIDPALRGKGYGALFISDVKASLAEQGIDRVFVNSGLAAIDFYRNAGFVDSSRTEELARPEHRHQVVALELDL